MHPFAPVPFYPRVSSLGGAPSHAATSTPSYRTPNDSRAQPHRDTRLRAPRPDGPRRLATVAPSNSSSDVSSVELWRLSVLDGAIPPAPPGTPVSVANVKLVGTPTSASPRLGLGVGQRHSRSGEPMSPASSTTWGESQCLWDGDVGEWKQEAFPLLVQRPGPAAKPMRHRNQYFKTKPCRFYGEPGGCIKGDRCNFIHEHPDEARRPSGLVAAVPPEVVSEGELESGAESSVQGESPSTVATSDHTPSVTSGSESKKSNFYPVTWRIVGGGVMMSGKREVCENFMAGHCPDGADCRFAHPETNEEEYTPYQEPPPVYSPISPILSPVMFAYPVVYPTLSPPQPFALPAVIPPQTPKSGFMPPNLAITPMPQVQVQASGVAYPYSPHRVVDGTTLTERQPEPYAQGFPATRPVVRPVSTPPTPMQGPDTGVARLFAAEMP
ncbi:hypothetical protein L226DRAFT_568908 [Lentinus tigrinus ALCF2SS1-7]|nr:hypothetical protein L226DRAFT_568908 [Lentinus tigrinus ALCF2SS1-7]